MMDTSDSPDGAHQELLKLDANARSQFVEARLVACIGSVRPPRAEPFDGSTRLSDLGLDSLQLVDVKFELDHLIGMELDIDLFLSNPTVRELAQQSLRAGGL
jgi:acyl carrier protein